MHKFNMVVLSKPIKISVNLEVLFFFFLFCLFFGLYFSSCSFLVLWNLSKRNSFFLLFNILFNFVLVQFLRIYHYKA